MTDALPDAIPAATLIVFRERAGFSPELLMVERAKAMAFAAGAMVFPGGRVDPADHALAAVLDPHSADPDDTAARIAAIRETIEEAGLPVGLTPLPATATFEHLRQSLHAGVPFAAALKEARVSLDLDCLVPFSRWRPAHRHMRIFDTRFYLARLPSDAPAPRVDATENVRLAWDSAQDVLDAADAGQLVIIFPTRRNLERLAQFEAFETAAADARRRAQRIVTPWEEDRNGRRVLCIPEGLGYPVTSEPIDEAMRG